MKFGSMFAIKKLAVFAIIGILTAGALTITNTAFAEPRNGWGKATS
ncbi:MAG: hypothetical protein M3162_00080 [Thermoproteota archaeon]|nr:hypothetical protein [Thermoproteota archaeon]